MKKKLQSAVGIVMGSDSDWPVVKEASRILREFGVEHDVHVISAHRTPDAAAEYARTAARRGLKIIVAAAGGAAHLAGVLAAHTTLPVIGIPMAGTSVNGLDSLLSTLQMPGGIPVATVTLGSAGPVNAAILAVEILALGRPDLGRRLLQHKRELRRKVEKADLKVQCEIVR